MNKTFAVIIIVSMVIIAALTQWPIETEEKTQHQVYRAKFHQYSDSFERYTKVWWETKSKCADSLVKYYYELECRYYDSAYPNNKYCTIHKQLDTICYPILGH